MLKLWLKSHFNHIKLMWIAIVTAYTLFSATTEKSSCIQLILYKLSVILGVVTVWLSYDRFSARFMNHPVREVKTNEKIP